MTVTVLTTFFNKISLKIIQLNANTEYLLMFNTLTKPVLITTHHLCFRYHRNYPMLIRKVYLLGTHSNNDFISTIKWFNIRKL